MRPAQTIASIDDLIRSAVAAEVERLLAERAALEWVSHVDLPFGSRARNATIARRIPGARRHGKVWLVPRPALNAYIATEGQRYQPPAEPANDEEQVDPAMLAAISRRRAR